MTVQQAGDESDPQEALRARQLGGKGGVIILDTKGNFAMPFNSEGMYRGRVGSDGKISVEIYH